MNTREQAIKPSRFGTIGVDLGSVGRAIRFLLGILMTARVVNTVMTAGLPLSSFVEVAAYCIASGLAYTLAYYLLQGPVLSRMNPWVGTAMILTPLLVILIAHVGTAEFQLGVRLYVGISLIVTSVMRYGGCEVIALPILLFGNRYPVYCPYNVIDVVEKAVTDRRSVR